MAGKQLRDDHRSRRAVRVAGAFLAVAALALTACSGQGARLGMPEPASEQALHVGHMWIGTWIAAFSVGALVWGLIGWSVARYRAGSKSHVPRQTKYHLPLELLYTLVPFLIIGVLFFYTVKVQDELISQTDEPDVVLDVLAQKWSWTFNYNGADDPAIGTDAHEVGTLEKIPDLYLPVDKTVRINLESADVIHSFWVPSFYFKLDVIPGHPNSFDVKPNRLGTYEGKCAELCGTYHSLMLFKLHVVTEEEYGAQVKQLAASGFAGKKEQPPSSANTIPTFSADKEQK